MINLDRAQAGPKPSASRTADLSHMLKTEAQGFEYKFALGGAILHKGPDQSEISFTLKLVPKSLKDKSILKNHAMDLLSVVDLHQYEFTLYDDMYPAIEPASAFPWARAKRILFFLKQDESGALSLENGAPTLSIKLTYPNYVVRGVPSIKIEDLQRGTKATVRLVKKPHPDVARSPRL